MPETITATLRLNKTTTTPIEYNPNTDEWELLFCVCRNDFTDGLSHCQACGKKRIQ